MKAVRFVGIHKPLQMQEIPIPEIGERDILVKVKAAGICHSDAHYRAGISPVSFTEIFCISLFKSCASNNGSKDFTVKLNSSS